MTKTKIAIAIDSGLLKQVDSLVDGVQLTSRSQAISHFLAKGMGELTVSHAVILLHKGHHSFALQEIEGKPLIIHQLGFFAAHGINSVYLSTQEGPELAKILDIASKVQNITLTPVLNTAQGTAQALLAVRPHVEHAPFLAMSGDTLNIFDLSRMVRHHMDSGRMATIGLVNKEDVTDCGVVLLDGDLIIHMEHSPKKPPSHIINAGIYVFRPEVFGLLSEEQISLEQDVFDQLVRIRQLQGRFTHGTYTHVPELRK